MTRVTVAAAMLMVLTAACGGSHGPDIAEARIGQPIGPNTALYLTASGDDGDRLVAARTDVATSVELHETRIGDDGSTGMRPVDGLELPPDGSLVLEPGGSHLMLVDVDRLDVGATVDVTLVWENAGEMTIVADVVEPADAMGEAP